MNICFDVVQLSFSEVCQTNEVLMRFHFTLLDNPAPRMFS